MPGRDEMLARVRKALGRPLEGPSIERPASFLPEPQIAGLMPALSPEDLLTSFEKELSAVGGQSYRAATAQELQAVFTRILDRVDPRTSGAAEGRAVALSRSPLLTQLRIADRLRPALSTIVAWPDSGAERWTERALAEDGNPRSTDISSADRGQFKEQCFRAVAGVTGVDFALAESGTLVLSSVTEGTQLASLAPPVHIALYRRHQLVASLEEALKGGTGATGCGSIAGRSLVLITGTSRTADIEQVLIRGVHGPREVHAILVEESCLD